MQYNQPFQYPPEVVWGDTPFINGNPATGQQGSIPPAASIEYPQREIVNIIREVGMTPTNTDLNQLGKAIQSGGLYLGVEQASSVVNSYVVALNPVPDNYHDGMMIWFRTNFANDGNQPPSINAGAGIAGIVRRGGGVPLANDIAQNANTMLCFNISTGFFELVNVTGGSDATGNLPQILTANLDLYINPTTGSDTLYDGSSATVTGGTKHGPFQHIQYAISYVFANYLPSAFRVRIHCAIGTFAESAIWPAFPGPTLEIMGNSKTTTFVTGSNDHPTFGIGSANTAYIHDLCVSTGTGIGPPTGFNVGAGATLSTYNTASGFCDWAIWEVYGPGRITVGNHTFNASNQYYLWAAAFGGFIALVDPLRPAGNAQYVLGGNLNLTNFGTGAAVLAFADGSVSIGQPPYRPVWSGAGVVTGSKFYAQMNGVIDTEGAGVSWLPGSIAGTTTNGGQCV